MCSQTIKLISYLIIALLVSTAPACDLGDTDPFLLSVTQTIELDFSNPNNTGGEVGYRYYLDGGDYPADYKSWQEWSCDNGPNYFGAWTEALTVWLGTCNDIDLTSINLTIDGQVFEPTTINAVPSAHETTYQLGLPQEAINLIYIIDHQPGVTTILVSFTQL